jgi:tetratricopeptide (TPR) repeat protein
MIKLKYIQGIMGIMVLLVYAVPVFSNAHKAMQYYLKEDYTNAYVVYKALQEQHPYNFSYNYNVAATQYKLDHIVQAKYYFLKALKIRPNHSDTLQNIDLINKQLLDQAFMGYNHWGHILGVNYRTLSAVLLIGIMIGGALILGYRKQLWRYKRPVVLAIFIYSICSLVVFSMALKQPTYGILTSKKSQVYSGPSKTQTALFFAHEGAEFEIIKAASDWANVQFQNGLTGWVPSREYMSL